MESIHEACVTYGKQADGSIDYVKGANIAGFMKVAQAMLEQGCDLISPYSFHSHLRSSGRGCFLCFGRLSAGFGSLSQN